MKPRSPTAVSIISWSILFLLSVLPLVFLPITQDFYDTNKWTLLAIVTILTLIVWTIKTIRSSEARVSLSPATYGLAAITLTSLASLFISSPNKVEALVNPFGPVTFAGLTILSLLYPTLENAAMKRISVWFLCMISSIFALISVYQWFGIGKAMFPAASFIADPLWSPAGSTVATITILVFTIPILIGRVCAAAKEKNEMALSVGGVMTILVLAGIGITAWQLVPRLAGMLLPIRDGWAIMLEILKNPKQAIFGVGADNFLYAFAIGRPASLNMTPIWSTRFTTNTNLFFHIITIYGLLGGGAFVYFAKTFLKAPEKSGVWASCILALISFLVVPPNLSVLVVVTLILLLTVTEKQQVTIKLRSAVVWPRIVLSAIMLLVVVAASYVVGKNYAAELLFYQSIRAAQQNNGTLTYNTQIAAMKQNPYISRFHIIFSQTNMALATSLGSTIQQQAQNKTTNQANITHDSQLVAQLVQQAISQAKAAVGLNQNNVLAWENLARTYAQLVGIAQGADNWSITSYAQASQLDPTNPLLHLELGSVYVQMKNYTNAITEFSRAAALKPDYANAFYNLSNAYKLNNDITQAIAALKQTQTLVVAGSDDYKTVTQELKNLETPPSAPVTTKEAPPKPSAVLTTPAPKPTIVPTLTLPNATLNK